MCGLMSDLVICNFRKSMVTHDTECPYWDQVSLNNTKPTKTNQTKPSVDVTENFMVQNTKTTDFFSTGYGL